MRIVHCLYILGLFWAFAGPNFALAKDPLQLSYYDVLSVNKDASFEQIKAARNELAKKYLNDPSPEGHVWMVAINRAYGVLKNPETRAAYDLESRPSRPASQPAETPQSPDPLEDWILSRFGNPDAMVSDRQRSVFYHDVFHLIQLNQSKSADPVARRIVIAGLQLLLKRHDPIGLQLFDQFYKSHPQQTRSPYMKQELCQGRLVDKSI